MGHSPREKITHKARQLAKNNDPFPISYFLFPISYFPFSSLLMFLAVGGRSGAGVGEKGFGEAERGGVTHGPGHLVEC